MVTAPLAGVKVVELCVALAGPWCTHVLASLGATVVKIEPLSGDESRAGGPPLWNGEAPLFLATNANKRSIALDLRRQEARDVVAELVERSDVVVQNLRPGAVARLGLDFEHLRERNPRIVYCNIGGFGHTGPLSEATAYDALIQAATGIMSTTRESVEHPELRTGPAIIDIGTGMWAAIGVLAALRARDAEGTAQLVDTSLFETGVDWQPMQILSYFADGVVPPPPGRASLIYAPFQAFDTADGTIVVGAGNNRLFIRLLEAMGRSELADDPRFATNVDRVGHREELAALLAASFVEKGTDYWLDVLRSAGLPVGPVQDIGALLKDPQLEALGLLQPLEHPRIPDLRLVAPPFSLNGERPQFRSAPPDLGQHTDEVLSELGYTSADIERLRGGGVIGGTLTER